MAVSRTLYGRKPYGLRQPAMTVPVGHLGTASGPFQFILILVFSPACAKSTTAAIRLRHSSSSIDVVQEQQHGNFQNVPMRGIAVFGNLDIAVEFPVNSFGDAKLYLLVIDKEHLSVVVGSK